MWKANINLKKDPSPPTNIFDEAPIPKLSYLLMQCLWIDDCILVKLKVCSRETWALTTFVM